MQESNKGVSKCLLLLYLSHLAPEILGEWQKAQSGVKQQAKHEEGAKLAIVDKGISHKIEGPANLPFRASLWFWLEKFWIDL